MKHQRRLTVNPVAGALGAEVGGVTLAGELSDHEFSEIHRAFLDHQVLFFRGQLLPSSALKAFAARFGPLYVHPYAKGVAEHPEVMRVVREADDVGRNFGGIWHADMTFEVEPVLGSVLYAVDVPSHGGDTLFASQYAGYDALSEGLKRLLVQLSAVHSASETLYGGGNGGTARTMALTAVDDIREVVHPVVRIHPATRQRGLFVNRLNTRRFEGWTEAESGPLLEFLLTHSVRPEFTCRFRWDRGSVALWENRCVQHLALNDYPGRRREMHRITITGDRPLGVSADAHSVSP